MKVKSTVNTFKTSDDALEFYKKYRELHGKDASDLVYSLKIIEHVLSEEPIRPNFFIQIVKNFLISVSAKDPNSFHFEMSRLALSLMPEEKHDTSSIDMLARELLEHLNKLERLIKIPDSLSKLKKACQENDPDKNNTVSYHLEFVNCHEANDEFEKQFFDRKGLSIWDSKYLSLLSSIGSEGRTKAEKISTILKKSEGGWDRGFWFGNPKNDKEELFYNSRAVIFLTQVLWVDIVKKRLSLKESHVPALTQSVIVKTIRPQLLKNQKIEVMSDNSLVCYSSKGERIASVPCVDPKILNRIRKGMQSFSSLSGHKLLRWQVKTGFENWVNGKEDPRLICTIGGYERIANLIGCGKSKKSPTEVKAILYAQAFGLFNYPEGGEGNMIILREMDKGRNGEPSKINIILGEMLLPNFTHRLPHGEKRRLIPITELPPLIGSNNTHAAQAMLQLLILEEFSKQSSRLASEKSILIPIEKWKEFATEAGLPLSCLNKVIMGWLEDDLFYKAFLQKQGDEYTLGAEYIQVSNFLEYQGQQRIDGAKGGRKSAEAKKELVKKIYTKKR